MTQNIYRDISNNLPYSIRKSNITIIYQPRNILYNILYKKEYLLIRNLGQFPTTFPLSDVGIYIYYKKLNICLNNGLFSKVDSANFMFQSNPFCVFFIDSHYTTFTLSIFIVFLLLLFLIKKRNIWYMARRSLWAFYTSITI